MTNSLVQIYTGAGKGKTTAATGLMVRALGQGMRVLLVRFLKPQDYPSGEILLLQQQPCLDILNCGEGILFGKPDKAKVRDDVQTAFSQACEKIMAGGYDMAVFDELNNCLHHGFLETAAVIALCDERPEGTELVFTGRNAPQELIDRADLVSVVEKCKHPMDVGIGARRGIEF